MNDFDSWHRQAVFHDSGGLFPSPGVRGLKQILDDFERELYSHVNSHPMPPCDGKLPPTVAARSRPVLYVESTASWPRRSSRKPIQRLRHMRYASATRD